MKTVKETDIVFDRRKPLAKRLIKNTFSAINAAALHGNKVRCNICQHTFRRFVKAANMSQLNGKCPICGSKAADRILWLYLQNEVTASKTKKHYLFFEHNTFIADKIFNTDLQVDIISFESTFQADKIFNEKIKERKYDVIIFAHLLEKTEDEQYALAKLRNLLRNGGYLLIMTIVNQHMDRTYEKPATSEDKERLGRYYVRGVKRVYGNNVAKHLAKAGFEVEAIDYADQLGNAARTYYQLGEDSEEIIYKCKKIDKQYGTN